MNDITYNPTNNPKITKLLRKHYEIEYRLLKMDAEDMMGVPTL